jgi:hypothetical protein
MITTLSAKPLNQKTTARLAIKTLDSGRHIQEYILQPLNYPNEEV